MKKELFIHTSFLISFLIIVSIFRDWLSIDYWPFWIGAKIGTLLPIADHLIYVYILRPHELGSQRVRSLFQNKRYSQAFGLIADTTGERNKMIFHTALFQLIFFALIFLVITSTSSIFAAGIVLGLGLHLLVDQITDYADLGGISHWFHHASIRLDRRYTLIYIGVSIAIFLYLSLFL